MVAEAYTEPEPHFAQILKVSEIEPAEVYPKAENKDPNAVWDKENTGVTRNGHQRRRESDRHPQPFHAGPDRRASR